MAGALAKIYDMQNRSIHKAMLTAGYPYNQHKDVWMPLLREIAGRRKVDGLSGLNLDERRRLIRYFRDRGHDVFSPFIPKGCRFWKKGDPEKPAVWGRPVAVPFDKEGFLKKIGAVLADMKLPWSYADSIALKRFGIEKIEWLEVEQLEKVMQMLIIYQRRKRDGRI